MKMSEFMKSLEQQIKILKASLNNHVSVIAGCDLFMRFSLATLNPTFEGYLEALIKKSNEFIDSGLKRRELIAIEGIPFIENGSVILVHSYSKVIMHLLRKALEKGIMFSVYITESRPAEKSILVVDELRTMGVPVQMILDSAVGYFIEKVDFVLVGAEGVVGTGGLINYIGTFQVAVIAKSAGKPVYAMAER